MKVIEPTLVTKMIDHFDNELKTILLADLEALEAAKRKILEGIQQTIDLSIA